MTTAVRLCTKPGFADCLGPRDRNGCGHESGSLYYYFREKKDILYEIQLMFYQRIAAIPAKVEE